MLQFSRISANGENKWRMEKKIEFPMYGASCYREAQRMQTEDEVFSTQGGLNSTQDRVVIKSLWRIKPELSLEESEWVRKNGKRPQGSIERHEENVTFWDSQINNNVTEYSNMYVDEREGFVSTECVLPTSLVFILRASRILKEFLSGRRTFSHLSLPPHVYLNNHLKFNLGQQRPIISS